MTSLFITQRRANIEVNIGPVRARYGLTGNPEWVPDLQARFGVKL